MLCTPRGEKRPPRGKARGNQGPTRWRLLIVISPPRGGRTYVIAPRPDSCTRHGQPLTGLIGATVAASYNDQRLLSGGANVSSSKLSDTALCLSMHQEDES